MSRTPLDPTRDWIGPPDPASRIRPLHLRRSRFDSDAERAYREQCEELQRSNDVFWRHHNELFEKQRRAYIQHTQQQRNMQPADELTADEMSMFYKQFLDERRPVLLAYNWQWYRRQFGLLWPATNAYWSRFRRLMRK